METIIKIDKEDIVTSIIGNNVKIHVGDKLSLVLSPEALDELVKDWGEIKKEMQIPLDIIDETLQLLAVKDSPKYQQLEIAYPQDDMDEGLINYKIAYSDEETGLIN